MVDIRCGGPLFLGFDFYVRYEDTEEMLRFIEEAIKEFDIPLINLSQGEKIMVEKKNVFTKARIVAFIKKDSEYLKEEAKVKEKVYTNNHGKT